MLTPQFSQTGIDFAAHLQLQDTKNYTNDSRNMNNDCGGERVDIGNDVSPTITGNSHHTNDNKSDSTISELNSTRMSRFYCVINGYFIEGMTPAYFVSVMGTGITSIILYNFPYFGQWLRVCSYIMFGIAFFFFIFLTLFGVYSIYKHPMKWNTFHRDIKVAPFMGTFVMGYITLVNMLYNFTGKDFIIGVWVFWWISVFLSVYSAFIVFFTGMISKNEKCKTLPASNLHATLLLPIVTLTVAASSGNIITKDLPNNNLKIITMLISYIMWSIAIFLAIIIITIHYWKLFVYKIPSTNLVFTSFLPVGVLGQGAFGNLLLGSNIYQFLTENPDFVFLVHNLTYASTTSSNEKYNFAIIIGNVFIYGCSAVSLFLISFGYFSTFIAVVSCLSKISPFAKNPNLQFTYNRNHLHPLKSKLVGLIPFSRNYWAMTFPLGTMALANTELHKLFNNLDAFRVIGTMYAVTLVLIVLICLLGCVYTAIKELDFIMNGSYLKNSVQEKV